MQKNIPKKKKSQNLESGISKYIKVNPIGSDSWQVDIYIPFLEMSPGVLPKILRIAKQKISKQQGFPLGLLAYEDLMEKDVKSEGVNISAKIVKGEAEKGQSIIRFQPAVSPHGVEYPDMLVYLDLYPFDDNGRELKAGDVWQLLADEGFKDEEQINVDAVQSSLDSLLTDLIPVKNILLAEGRFPERGNDADVEYSVPLNRTSEGILTGTKSVQPGDKICIKKPPIPSSVVGYTVRGETLEPLESRDIVILIGENVDSSKDQLEIIASKRGLPKIIEQEPKEKHVKSVLNISVELMEVIDGSKKISITTDKHIEITGGLKEGSQIISKGEVIIEGDVADNTSVIASGGINISGNINGGSLTSDGDIISTGEVNSAKLVAHGTLKISGTAYNSDLKGNDIYVDELVGGKISAGNKAVIDSVSSDEKGLTAKISVGLMAHLSDKIEDNNQFIEFAKTNLDRYRKILSEKIIQEATPTKVPRMLILHAKDLKKEGVHRINQKQMKILKKLIISIGPIRDLMKEKERSNKLFEEQLKRNPESDAEIKIGSRTDKNLDMELSGDRAVITVDDGPVSLKREDGKITKILIDS